MRTYVESVAGKGGRECFVGCAAMNQEGQGVGTEPICAHVEISTCSVSMLSMDCREGECVDRQKDRRKNCGSRYEDGSCTKRASPVSTKGFVVNHSHMDALA